MVRAAVLPTLASAHVSWCPSTSFLQRSQRSLSTEAGVYSGYHEIGCFAENNQDHLAPADVKGKMTISGCFQACRDSMSAAGATKNLAEFNNRFFALKGGNQCFCATAPQLTVGEGSGGKKCTTPCEGATGEQCGSMDAYYSYFAMHKCGAHDRSLQIAADKASAEAEEGLGQKLKGHMKIAIDETSAFTTGQLDKIPGPNAKFARSMMAAVAKYFDPLRFSLAPFKATKASFNSAADNVASDTALAADMAKYEAATDKLAEVQATAHEARIAAQSFFMPHVVNCSLEEKLDDSVQTRFQDAPKKVQEEFGDNALNSRAIVGGKPVEWFVGLCGDADKFNQGCYYKCAGHAGCVASAVFKGTEQGTRGTAYFCTLYSEVTGVQFQHGKEGLFAAAIDYNYFKSNVDKIEWDTSNFPAKK